MVIDLEKELVRANKKISTPKELLVLNEYEKHADISDNEVLSRLGLNSSMKEGQSVKNEKNRELEEASRFNQEKVFHISQIEDICNKYYLKFLQTDYFCGSVDEKLPYQIAQFETAYDIKTTRTNTFIVAPKESFKLQEKPKDPLMFYRINDSYFYLIHKWGNDLSMLRRLKSVFSNPTPTFYVSIILPTIIAFMVCYFNLDKMGMSVWLSAVTFVISFFIWGGITTNNGAFFKENEWRNTYIE